jgi:hypothetical protein
VLRGKGKGYVRVSCAATRAGIRITYRAVGAGVTLKSVLTGKPRLIVSRSKYATKTKRLRVLWHATG